MAASPSQRQWNKGMVDGPSADGREVQRPGRCTTDGCGTRYTGTTPEGMTRVRVDGSVEPERVYCSAFCVEYGQALGELRIPAGSGVAR